MLTRVALLTTNRAPGLEYLLQREPARPYELVFVLATDPDSLVPETCQRAGIPAAIQDIRSFYRERHARLGDLDVRQAFDHATRSLLRLFDPEIVVLSGYLHIVTAPLLQAFPGRIINIHDADLALRGADGKPRYRGLRSTRDAVFAGERETRCTAHLVTEELDAGPILARSDSFPVHQLVGDARRCGATDILKAYAYAQREWMMRMAWGPLVDRAIRHVTTAQVAA